MGIVKHEYLTPRMLKGLAAYKYKAGGYTWLDDLHNPAWNWIVEKVFPTWLAPNLVTLVGLMFIIGSHALLAIYAPDLDGEAAPRSVHFFAGISLVIYVNLDCMDGKQARRTGTSSPLGQLFDHGCDALSVGLILVSCCASASLQLSQIMAAMLSGPLTTWILAQWEEYHTGVMQYGNGYFGILEANYALAGVHFISASVGPHVWQRKLGYFSEKIPEYLSEIIVVDLVFSLSAVFMAIQIIGQVVRVFSSNAASMDIKDRGSKELGTLAAMKHLLLMFGLYCVSYLFLMQPEQYHPFFDRALLMCVMLTYTMFATQLIMAHMAKEVFQPQIGVFVVGLLLGVSNWLLNFVDPVGLTFSLTGVFIFMYLHYTVNVCNQVCSHLGIKCLTIPVHKQD